MFFLLDDIKKRDKIIKMLKYEDELYFSKEGQQILREHGDMFTSLDGPKTIQRMVLNKFGYYSTENDLINYRKIFSYYYIDPTNYDHEVLNSVFYFRENKCLYYNTKPIEIGDKIPNISIYNLDGQTKTNIYDLIKNNNLTFMASFSMS